MRFNLGNLYYLYYPKNLGYPNFCCQYVATGKKSRIVRLHYTIYIRKNNGKELYCIQSDPENSRDNEQYNRRYLLFEKRL